MAFNLDVTRSHFIGEDLKNSLDHFVGADGLLFRRMLPGKTEKALDDFLAALATLDDIIQVIELFALEI